MTARHEPTAVWLRAWIVGWRRGSDSMGIHARPGNRYQASLDLAWDLNLWTEDGEFMPDRMSELLARGGWAEGVLIPPHHEPEAERPEPTAEDIEALADQLARDYVRTNSADLFYLLATAKLQGAARPVPDQGMDAAISTVADVLFRVAPLTEDVRESWSAICVLLHFGESLGAGPGKVDAAPAMDPDRLDLLTKTIDDVDARHWAHQPGADASGTAELLAELAGELLATMETPT